MKNKSDKIVIFSFFLIILVIGIGYAYLTSNLSITSTTAVTGNTWNIHFDNIVVTEGSVTTTTPAIIDTNDNTKVNFAVNFAKPGDFYEFTVDVVNDGTLDGMIGSITSTINGEPISNLPVYLGYSLTYTDDNEIANNHLLEAGHTETYKIRLVFKEDIDEDELPSTDSLSNFTFDVDYIQSNSNAFPRPIGYMLYTRSGNYNIGDNVSELGTTYNTLLEAQTATGSTFFIKTKIVNNVVAEAYISYIINNTEYNLKGAGGVLNGTEWDYSNVAYEENKETLIASLGEENCEESVYDYDTDYYKSFFCHYEDVDYGADSKGWVLRKGNNGEFTIMENGEIYCG